MADVNTENVVQENSSAVAVEAPPPSDLPTASLPEVAELTPDSFKWDEWDGSAYDPFPEPVRPWVERATGTFKSKHETEYTKQIEAAKELERIYNELLATGEDPRIKDLGEKLKSAEEWRANSERNLAQLIADREADRAAFEAYQIRQAEEAAARFQEANAWIFDNGPMQQSARELLKEEFPLEMLPELLKLQPSVLERARHHHKELVATGAKGVGKQAVALAKAEFQPPPSNPAGELVTGANRPNPGPSVRGRPPTDASFADLKLEAARRALGE